MTAASAAGQRALLNNDPQTTADFQHEWNARRVLVIHTLDRGSPHREDAEARLGDAILANGYRPEDVAALYCDSDDITAFGWPRNVSWNSLPTIGDPRYVVEYGRRYLLGEADFVPGRHDRTRSGNPAKDAPIMGAAVEMVVLASDELSVRDLHEVEILRRQERPYSDLRIRHFDGRAMRDVDASDVLLAWEKHYPHDRFVYNHALNLLVLGGRAYLSVAREQGDSQRHVEEWMPRFHTVHWKFGHPLPAQVLCRLAGRSGSTPTTWFADVPQIKEWLWANRSPLFEKTSEGDEFRWKGTGLYREWKNLITPHVSEKTTKLEGTPFNRSYFRDIVNWMSSLNFAGFVCIDQDGEVCLTSRGRRYAAIIAPALEDPDVLLRWRTDDGLLCSIADVPAVDRWMNRAFRKLKRAVASLPASPVVEEGEQPWPRCRTNVLLVRGYRVDVTEEMLADSGFADEVTRIEALQASKPFSEWREGVVRRPVGFGVTGQVEHLWFGHPLAVCADPHKDIARYELLADFKQLDSEIAALKIPHWVTAGAVIKTLAFDEPHREEAMFYAPRRLIVEDEFTCPIVFGQVLRLPLPIVDGEIREFFKLQDLGAAFVGKNVDGIRTFGRGPAAKYGSVSVGIQVGAYDLRRGEGMMDTSVCDRRTENLERAFGGYRSKQQMDCILGNPELSAPGCWIMLPDGDAIKFIVNA